MKCDNCGSLVNPGDQVCINCGAKLSSTNAYIPEVGETITKNEEPKKDNKLFILGVILVVVIVLIIIFFIIKNFILKG